jgi:predicted RNA-binding Zn ribbon-like protein
LNMSKTPVTRSQKFVSEPVTVRLMNTINGDTTGLHDSLETHTQLLSWLAECGPEGVIVKDADDDDLRHARRLRDAVRRLAALAIGDPRPLAASPLADVDAAVAVVNEFAAKRPADALALHDGRLVSISTSRESEAMTALADIADEARGLLAGPEAAKLRACLAPGCVRYFIKSHPRREWCADACGNRVRAARHYDRVRSRREASVSASSG